MYHVARSAQEGRLQAWLVQCSVTSGEPGSFRLALCLWAHQLPQARSWWRWDGSALPPAPTAWQLPAEEGQQRHCFFLVSFKEPRNPSRKLPRRTLRPHWPELSHMPTPKPVITGLFILIRLTQVMWAISGSVPRKEKEITVARRPRASVLPLHPAACAFHPWYNADSYENRTEWPQLVGLIYFEILFV